MSISLIQHDWLPRPFIAHEGYPIVELSLAMVFLALHLRLASGRLHLRGKWLPPFVLLATSPFSLALALFVHFARLLFNFNPTRSPCPLPSPPAPSGVVWLHNNFDLSRFALKTLSSPLAVGVAVAVAAAVDAEVDVEVLLCAAAVRGCGSFGRQLIDSERAKRRINKSNWRPTGIE